jgi:hypothetical protein
MKKLSTLLLGISFILLIVSVIGLILNKEVIQKEKFYADINVTDKLGLDVNGSALKFGNIIKGGNAIRRVSIDNNYEYPVIVHIEAEGNIAPLLSYDNNFIIKSGESKSVGINAYGLDYGDYVGNVSIELLRG